MPPIRAKCFLDHKSLPVIRGSVPRHVCSTQPRGALSGARPERPALHAQRGRCRDWFADRLLSSAFAPVVPTAGPSYHDVEHSHSSTGESGGPRASRGHVLSPGHRLGYPVCISVHWVEGAGEAARPAMRKPRGGAGFCTLKCAQPAGIAPATRATTHTAMATSDLYAQVERGKTFPFAGKSL